MPIQWDDEKDIILIMRVAAHTREQRERFPFGEGEIEGVPAAIYYMGTVEDYEQGIGAAECPKCGAELDG